MDVQQALEPTRDHDWLLVEQSYDPLRESSVESRFAVSNGFLGVRGARAISRGPTWVSWLHTFRWASWPRTYVAGLFDTPNTEPPVPALVPVADWLRLRVLLERQAPAATLRRHAGHQRILDMRRGVMLTEWRQRDPSGIVVRVRTLRLVSHGRSRARAAACSSGGGARRCGGHGRTRSSTKRAPGSIRCISNRTSACGAPNSPARAWRWPAPLRCNWTMPSCRRGNWGRSDGPGAGRRHLVRPHPSSA